MENGEGNRHYTNTNGARHVQFAQIEEIPL